MSATTTTVPPCPECDGEHLWNWLWRHTATCPLLTGEDATRAADAERLAIAVTFTRPATTVELDLARALGWLEDAGTFRHLTDPVPPASPRPTTTVRRSDGAGPHRTVDGIDPDDLSTWSTDDDD